MIPLDTHNHLKHWSDGRQTIGELIELAVHQKVRLGLADHAGQTDFLNSPERLEEYADYLSEYPVARGYEMDLDRSILVPPDIKARFDYAIASVHGLSIDGQRVSFSRSFGYLQGKNPGYDPRGQIPNPDAFFKAHLDLLKSEFSKQPFDILGHCSVLPLIALGSPEEIFPEWWEDELIMLLKRHRIAMEISNRWKTPYQRLLQKCMDAGNLFSMGSDGHDLTQSCRLEYPLEMISRYSIPPERLFEIGSHIHG